MVSPAALGALWLLAVAAVVGTAAQEAAFQALGSYDKTCTYTALDVPASVFFSTEEQLFPLDHRNVRYDAEPWKACFGPGESTDSSAANSLNAIKQGDKLPCSWRRNSKGNIDYSEEHACDVLLKQNCYGYAVGRYVGSYTEPGYAGLKRDLPSPIWDCTEVVKGVIGDGGIKVDRKTVYSQKPTGHYIAAAVLPADADLGDTGDFHFWRLDQGGVWSYKGGQTLSRRTFKNGTLLLDVESPEARGDYKLFCGYFEVFPERHKLAGTGYWLSSIPQRFEAWRAAGLRASMRPLPKISQAWRLAYPEFWRHGWVDETMAAGFSRDSARYSTRLAAYSRSARPAGKQ